VLRKPGYRGGFKSAEVQLNLKRKGTLPCCCGVNISEGMERDSTPLVQYNLEDVVNLQYLADVAYNEVLARLPIGVDPLPI